MKNEGSYVLDKCNSRKNPGKIATEFLDTSAHSD